MVLVEWVKQVTVVSGVCGVAFERGYCVGEGGGFV